MHKNSNNSVYGEWLSEYKWTMWTTLTTRYTLTQNSARRIVERFYRELSRAGNTQIFFATEPHDIKEGYHLHALINSPDLLTYKNVIDTYQEITNGGKEKEEHTLPTGETIIRTKWNRIQIEKYNPKLGATHYLSKYITKKMSDYDILTNQFSRKHE